jgi:hypothetical protein
MADSVHALAPSNEDLMSLAYDEGTLSTEESAHLEHCPICQELLAAYKDTNTYMLSSLYRSLCPGAVTLNYYCLGGMPVEERTSIANHLLDCPLCADEVVEIRRDQANYDLFPTSGFALGAAVRRIFANLVVQQAQPVLRDDLQRAQGTGWPRQYRAESTDLSLHLSHASSGEIMLLGIITSSDPTKALNAFEGVKVDLYTAPLPTVDQENEETIPPLLSTEIDEVGNIFLEPVPPGNYVMLIHLPDQEIAIEGLNIDHR